MMTKKTSIVTVVALLFIYSCDKEVEIIDVIKQVKEPSNELVLPQPYTCINEVISITSCEEYSSYDSTKYCTPQYLGDYQFGEIGRNFSELFCSQHGDVIDYINGNSDTLKISIVDLRQTYGSDLIRTSLECESDSSRSSLFCFNGEVFSVRLESPNQDLVFGFSIFLDVNFVNDVGAHYTSFEIWEQTSESSWSSRMDVIIDKGTSSKNERHFDFFYDSLLINNKMFYDVYAQKLLTSTEPINKYYITLDQGLIAILSKEGEYYTIDN